MENMLREIVETDKASRLDVEKAMRRREELTRELAEKKKETEEKYKQAAKIQTENARRSAQEEISAVEKKIEEETQAKSRALDDIFEKEHKKWEDSVFSAVTED